jgi:hypothetical protein
LAFTISLALKRNILYEDADRKDTIDALLMQQMPVWLANGVVNLFDMIKSNQMDVPLTFRYFEIGNHLT